MNEAAYRAAESALWKSVGVVPTERSIRLATIGTDVRIQEVGSGPTTLLLHGSPSSGAGWAHLVPHLADRRTVMIDLPGTGLSEPLGSSVTASEYFRHIVVDCLDALDVDRALVVGSSSGGSMGLKAAAEHPARVSGLVIMGTPGWLEELGTPFAERLMLLPVIGALMGRMRPGARTQRKMWRSIGHGASLDEGRLDDSYLEWWGALLKHTDSLRNDMAVMRLLRGRAGAYAREHLISPSARSRVSAPTLLIWGEHETFGDRAVADALVASIPNADMKLINGGGHLPWIDAPEEVATMIEELVAV
ncbi:MAG: alpha/beta hydrolase [Acidimicrobiia bacterium]|nr:alpha/beta hydrolase [Acidimicrobiia bacterium]